jgi:hypothetical protein
MDIGKIQFLDLENKSDGHRKNVYNVAWTRISRSRHCIVMGVYILLPTSMTSKSLNSTS